MRRKDVTARKRKHVERLLRNPKWRTRSTNWIAQQAGVSWLFVDKVRTQLAEAIAQVSSNIHGKRVGKDGKEYAANGHRRLY